MYWPKSYEENLLSTHTNKSLTSCRVNVGVMMAAYKTEIITLKITNLGINCLLQYIFKKLMSQKRVNGAFYNIP